MPLATLNKSDDANICDRVRIPDKSQTLVKRLPYMVVVS